jgi:hypothetical protein
MSWSYSADLSGSMSPAKQAVDFRIWAECVAGAMTDPVKRLRFVRSVAPLTDIWGERRGRRRRRMIVAMLIVLSAGAAVACLSMRRTVQPAPPPAPEETGELAAPSAAVRPPGDVWLVDRTATSEVYSNGLQIDNTFAVSARRRTYLVFPVGGADPPATRSDPAGIVFHGTESQQLPFEAGHNDALKRVGESLLEYVQRRRSYHFVIDRFGRVHRIVNETDVAEHAGYSAWADGRWLYVNLNQSFLGVAFEARTSGGDSEPMTAAQSRSAAMLVEMLRARHRILAENCVTHAQVSVNPSNMRLGYHVDWASEFPFREVGLPDNYVVPPASIWRFGFECDAGLRRSLRVGVEAAEAIVRRQAAAAGMSPLKWRQALRQSYRQKLAAVRHGEVSSR